MTDKAWRKYLDHYAEPLALHIASELTGGAFDAVVAIPCYAEADLLPGCIRSLARAAQNAESSVVAIILVNAKQSDHADKLSDNTQALHLLRTGRMLAAAKQAALYAVDDRLSILSVDCSSDGQRFPESEGVGLARKLACDIAVALKDQERIKSAWIRNTDCDTLVPLSYFQEPTSNAACIVEAYEHHPQDQTASSWQALQEYEIWLRYYVAGLAYARSPYAYHSIGSTMTSKFDAYCKVRGIPKRLAGEDFHYLNKVAKTGAIAVNTGEPLVILDRPSDRVPFGTGAGVAKILGLKEQAQHFPFYDPRCFEVLKTFLSCVSENETLDDLPSEFAESSGLHPSLVGKLWAAFDIRSGMLAARKNTKTQAAFLQQANVWFDALKTLRFIHFLRDEAFGSRDVFTACQMANFLPKNVREAPSLDELLTAWRAKPALPCP